MATIKSFTSLEQSKKLAEILPLESADMHYNNASIKGINYVDEYRAELMEYNRAIKVLSKYTINPLFKVIPAWSLTTLLEYAKHAYKDGYIAIESCVGDDERWQVAIYSYEEGSVKAFEELKLIDAAFQMVCWLHKLKML